MNSAAFATACIMMRVTRLTYCDMGVFLILMTLLPIVLNEFFWSVGQSVYTYVYGHMGTNELAGMSLTGAVQGLTMGALSGLSQAAGILTGKRLGSREYDAAYEDSKKLCGLGVVGSLVFTLLLILIRNPYVQLFNVSGAVRGIGADILAAFAILMPVKVQNMILGGGIIRSGGEGWGTGLSASVLHGGTHDEEKIRESYESGILSMVKSNNRITRKEMAEKLSISLRSLQRIINKMDELHYVGSGNHGHWEIRHDQY